MLISPYIQHSDSFVNCKECLITSYSQDYPGYLMHCGSLHVCCIEEPEFNRRVRNFNGSDVADQLERVLVWIWKGFNICSLLYSSWPVKLFHGRQLVFLRVTLFLEDTFF
jgi:hypothetical protein